MRTERWWWLGGFLLVSILIHALLALHGPSFGLQGYSASSKEIELTLETLPPEKKPHQKPRPKVAEKPKPKPLPKIAMKPPPKPPKVAKIVEKRPVLAKTAPKIVQKVAVKPLEEKPVVPTVATPAPKVQIAKAPHNPMVTPAVAKSVPTVKPEALPETLPEQTASVKTPAIAPRMTSSRMPLPMANPLSGLTSVDDKPQAMAAPSNTPRITRMASARAGGSGGASGGGQSRSHGPQTPTDLPQADGLPGGMHFPRMASKVGGESILSVKNPLADFAVPEDKPGYSAGVGGHPGVGSGRGSGGLHGILMASRNTGTGAGRGGGIGGGQGAGRGSGSGSGRGNRSGTGTGRGGSGSGDGADQPGAGGDGFGRLGAGLGTGAGGTGRGPGGGFRLASGRGGGGIFGDVGGILHGEPPRAPGDGQPGRNGHGLAAEIYEGQPYLTRLVHHRADATIDFNWGMTIPVVNGVSRIFSMRWTGEIQPKYSETYTFATQEDDGLRLWVDGQLLVSDWKDHERTGRHGSIHLEAGRKYDIKIEYFNGPDHARTNILGHAEVHLRWSSPSQPLQIVPESALYQPE